MAKMTKKQMETLVDFGYFQHMAEKFDGYASKALHADDRKGFVDSLNTCYFYGDQAVKAARKLGMTDDLIDKISVSLLSWSKFHNENNYHNEQAGA